MITIELETERLRLRQWRLDHFEPYAAFYGDPEASKFVDGPKDRGMAWYYMACEAGHWHLRGYGMWALEEKATGDMVGFCGLWHPGDWPEIELGWSLFRPARGQGFATEAAKGARFWAYETLGLKTLVSYIDPENEPSKRVAKRLGASYEQTITLRDTSAEVYRHPAPDGAHAVM